MADPSATRFGLEAVFLVLLAVAVGFADLRTWLIAVVMGGGWLLVALIEWLAWRSSRPAAPTVLSYAPPAPVGGWDVQEIIAPAVVDEPEPEPDPGPGEEPEPEAMTTVLEAPAEDDSGTSQARRRWPRRSRGAQ